jgi:hypothetical protein
MYNYSVTPPPEAWKKIAAALDESGLSKQFPATLYNLEAAPPVGAWEKIKSSLETGIQQTPPRKTIPWFRYAAAAAIITCLAWGGLQLMKGTGNRNQLTKEAALIPRNDSIHKKTKSPADESVSVALTVNKKQNHPRLNTAIQSNPGIETGNSLPVPVNINDGRQEVYAALHENGTTEPDAGHTEMTFNTTSRYVELMTPDGNVVRLSKKLGDLMCCVSGEEQDAGCRDQLQKWREKIACAPVTASPGNFMDIFSLVNSLQQSSN